MAWIIMEMSENNKLLANCYRANDNICFYYIQDELAESKKHLFGVLCLKFFFKLTYSAQTTKVKIFFPLPKSFS